MQLVPGDAVLMRNDVFQGKKKVKDWWSQAKYVVVCKVTDGILAYKVRDKVRNVKTVHQNQLFLVAAPAEAVTPLGAGMSISPENIIRSTLAEFTPLGIESDLPASSVAGTDTLGPASLPLPGWVGGVLWPLTPVALRLTIWRGLGAGDGVWSQSDEEVY